MLCTADSWVERGGRVGMGRQGGGGGGRGGGGGNGTMEGRGFGNIEEMEGKVNAVLEMIVRRRDERLKFFSARDKGSRMVIRGSGKSMGARVFNMFPLRMDH